VHLQINSHAFANQVLTFAPRQQLEGYLQAQKLTANQLEGGGSTRLGDVDPAIASAHAEAKEQAAAQAMKSNATVESVRKDEVLVRVAILHPKKRIKVTALLLVPDCILVLFSLFLRVYR
jgi:hypothetical protein